VIFSSVVLAHFRYSLSVATISLPSFELFQYMHGLTLVLLTRTPLLPVSGLLNNAFEII